KKVRKMIVEFLTNLDSDLVVIADSHSQIDPKFQSERLYTRLTVYEFRKKLIEKKGYIDSELPTNQTLNTIINILEYKLKKVKKSKPLKKIEETDLIFNNLNIIHETIAATDRVLTQLSFKMRSNSIIA
ncbi:MAG: ISAzo13 family transposase, partial [Clostridiales bacterium]